MKKKIKKSEYDKLSDEIKGLYKVANDNAEEYKLDLEDEEDVTNLKSALEKERSNAKEYKKKLEKYEEQNISAEEAKLKAEGKITELEESYKEKNKKLKQELEDKYKKLESSYKRTILENESIKLASELFPNIKLGLPHVKGRLDIMLEEVDGEIKPSIKVLDSNGKLSASSIDDFKKEILTDSDLSAIVKAPTSASGGGSSRQTAGSQGPKGATGPAERVSEPQRIRDLPPAERLAAIQNTNFNS